MLCACPSSSLQCSSLSGLICKLLVSFQVPAQNRFLEEEISVQPLLGAPVATYSFLTGMILVSPALEGREH